MRHLETTLDIEMTLRRKMMPHGETLMTVEDPYAEPPPDR
jgi:hypothetical protein